MIMAPVMKELIRTPQFKKSFDGFLEDGDLLCDKSLKSVFKIKQRIIFNYL